MSQKHQEIAHGRKLAENDPLLTWGWGTPAGKRRAARRADLIVNGARLKFGQHVLEIGCGSGFFTEIFAMKGLSLVALDISPELIALARRRNIPPESVRFFSLPFDEFSPTEEFDAIIGSSILHHLDLDTSLPKIYSLLKPGGTFCFAEPNMLNPQIFLQKNLSWLKRLMGDTPDETAFVRWALASLLRKSGFVNITIVPFDWLHPLTPTFLIEPMLGIGRILEYLPVIREFSGSLIMWGERPSC